MINPFFADENESFQVSLSNILRPTWFIPSLHPNPTIYVFCHPEKVRCSFIHFVNSCICQAIPSNIIKWRLWSIRQKKIWQFTQGWLSKQRSLFVYKSKSQKKVNHNLEEKSWRIFCDKQDSIMCAKPNTTFQTQAFEDCHLLSQVILAAAFCLQRHRNC